MKFNELFYHEALRMLQTGTTKEEFAKNYANASKEDKNSSIWQELYNDGQKIFSQNLDIVDKNSTIDNTEFKLFEYMLNFLKNLPNYRDKEQNTPSYKGETDDMYIIGVDAKLETLPEGIKAKKLENREELTHLKSLEIMSRQEMIDEIKLYNVDYELTDDMDDLDVRCILSSIRRYIVRNDKGSQGIDYHIGSFFQGKLGTCAPLSQIAQLKDEELKEYVHEGIDENGKYYIVTFPMDKNKPENSVKIYESEVLSGELKLPHVERPMKGFSMGDDDVTLWEMAYVRRFGTASVKNGETGASAQNLFTTPEEESSIGEGKVTEEKLILANQKKATLGNTSWSTDDEHMSYHDEAKMDNDVTAKWQLAESRERIEKKLKSKFPQIDESKYKNLSEQEFMEFIMLLVQPDKPIDKAKVKTMSEKDVSRYLKECEGFNFNEKLVLSNGQKIIIGHAYIFRSYNPETEELIISDTNFAYEDIVINKDIAEKFLRISY